IFFRLFFISNLKEWSAQPPAQRSSWLGEWPTLQAYFTNSKVPTYLEHPWNVPGTIGLPAAVVFPLASPLMPFHLPVPCRNFIVFSGPNTTTSALITSPSGSMIFH